MVEKKRGGYCARLRFKRQTPPIFEATKYFGHVLRELVIAGENVNERGDLLWTLGFETATAARS